MDLANGAMDSSGSLVDSADDMSQMSTSKALGQWRSNSSAVWIQMFFTVVCIGFGILMIVRGRRQNRQGAMDDSDDSDASARRDAERRERYLHCSLDEASDPDTWMEVRHHHDEEEKYYMQIRAPIPSDSWESPSQPHEPVAAAFIEAIDYPWRGWQFGYSQLLNGESWETIAAATYGGADAGAIRFYTDAVGTLSNAFDRFESGELNDNSLETRNILREFARFSPRADSPAAAMSMDEMADELGRYQRNQRSLDDEEIQLRGAIAMEVDDDFENQPMDGDLNLNGIHNNVIS